MICTAKVSKAGIVLRYRPEAKVKAPRERKKKKQLEVGDSSK
jgi:hypothetical protein